MDPERRPGRIILSGPRGDVLMVPIPLRGGGTTERVMINHPGSVMILPITADGRVILIQNVRHTTQSALLELPAGTMSKGEDPLLCAHRELLEETGYRAGSMKLLADWYTAPGLTNERMHVYVATDLTEVGQQLEADEQITVVPLPLTEAIRRATSNELDDAKTIAGLLLYAATGSS